MRHVWFFLLLSGFTQPADAFQAVSAESGVLRRVAPRDEKVSATEETARLSDLIEGSIDWYELNDSSTSSEKLKAKPVMRWRNVTRGQDGEAMMVIWTDGQRPEAVASIYPWLDDVVHEFDSLSRGRSLRALEDGTIVWAPAQPGLSFKPLINAESPAATPVARQRQMKALAARFTGVMTGWKADNSDREELRLLPRALYRYEIPADENRRDHVIDGCIIAFVSGTDPEILLVLEAVDDGKDRRWEFACARATSGGLEMRLDKDVIWTALKFPDDKQTLLPHISLRKPIPER